MTISNALPASQLTELRAAWAAAIVPKEDKQAQALGLGGNFAINIPNALKAIWSTAKIAFTVHKIALLHIIGAEDGLGLAADTWTGATSAVAAFYKSLSPLQYVASVVLSGFPEGIISDDYRKEIEKFLEEGGNLELPWYLGLSQGRIENARDEWAQENAYENTIKWLTEEGYLKVESDRYFYQAKNIDWSK